jgi:hypothetical protein
VDHADEHQPDEEEGVRQLPFLHTCRRDRGRIAVRFTAGRPASAGGLPVRPETGAF